MANFFWQRDSFIVEHHQRLQMSLEQNDQGIPNSTDQCCHAHSFQISPAKEKLKGKWGNFTRPSMRQAWALLTEYSSNTCKGYPACKEQISLLHTALCFLRSAKLEITLIELTLLNVCWSKLCNGIALSQEWLKWMKLEATTWTEFITTCPRYFTERTSLKKPKATGKGLKIWHDTLQASITIHLQVHGVVGAPARLGSSADCWRHCGITASPTLISISTEW